MKNKKISLIISTYDDLKNPYYAGGGALAINEITKRLVNKYDITIITGKYPGCKNETLDGIAYERIGSKHFGGKFGQLAYQFCLPGKVLTKKYDIWFESFTPPFSTSCLQLLTTKPVVGIVHMLSGEDMKRKYKLPFDVFEKFGLQTYKNIIVLSENMKKKINKINQKINIAIIPNGVSVTNFGKSTHDKKHILFIGRIEVNQKGLDLLLEAYAKIADTIKYPLVIAGAGETVEEEKLKKLIMEMNLTNKVKLAGRVHGEEKEKIYRNAVCVVSTSRFETFPIVALETMSYGIPFICFAIEGFSWIPSTIAKKVKPFDGNALAEAITSVVSNQKVADVMTKEGTEFVKQFTWDSIATKYENKIKELTNSI